MKDIWAAAGTIEKVGGVLLTIAAIWGVGSAIYNHWMPRDEAHLEHQEIAQQIVQNQKSYLERDKFDRIDRHDREIARYERDLIDPDIPERERAFIAREIQRLEALKACIRSESC